MLQLITLHVYFHFPQFYRKKALFGKSNFQVPSQVAEVRTCHRACRKTRREFLICPEGGDRGEVQLTQLDDNAGSKSNADEEGIIAAECHLCHDGGIKCILGHRVPKESIDVIRYMMNDTASQ